MITPSYGLTATERVLPGLALDWTTGLSQSGVDVTRAGVATFIGSNGLVQSATADTQRVDYSTGTAGLLVEESRTNLLPYSIPDAGVPTGYTVAIATGTYTHTLESGFGVLSGFQQVVKHEQTVSGRSPLNLALTLSASTTYTLSIYVDTVNSEITSGGTIILQANGYSDATGTISATLADADANGRIAITFTTGTDVVGNIRFGVGVTANATGVLYMGGWQLEAGAFPTSYIPTEATAVTRNADVATMTGTNFSDWWNPTEGTFVVDFDSVDVGASRFPNAITVSDGTTAERIFLSLVSVSRRTAAYSSSAAQYDMIGGGLGSTTANAFNRLAIAFKANSFIGAAMGSLGSLDTAGVVPTLSRINFGSSPIPNNFLNGHVMALRFYPQRLINAEAQAFSK